MMKRYLLTFILGIITLGFASGQIVLGFESQNGNANSTVDIDVTITGFSNIAGLQYSVGWDSTVMKFNSVVSTNPALSDLSANNISGPEGAALIEGQFSFSYNNPQGNGNLDDGAVMYTVRFDLVGAECSSTALALTDDPTPIEAFDGSFNILTVTAPDGEVMINGADCGGGGTGGNDTDLMITAEMVSASQGANVCVPLTVKNFNNVGSGSGTIFWDPNIVSYTGISNIKLNGVGSSLNETNTSGGELKFVWSNPDPANPLSIPDGEQLFDICFDAVGSVGEMSAVTLSTQGSLGFEFFDDDDVLIAQSLTNGKVTITGNTADAFTLIVSDVTVNKNAGTGCVDVSVKNFNNIISTQYVLKWDPSVINNGMPSNYNLDGLNVNSFNTSSGSSVVSWSVGAGISVPDNTVIYSYCFDLVGDCDESSPVEVVSQGTTQIEVVDGNTSEVDNVVIEDGSLTIGCMGPCEITAIDRPCAGSLNGNVTVNVEDGCSYSWTNSSGTQISTSKNLLGVGAGTYTLVVSCNGAESCTLTAVVESLSALNINETVTNAGCGTSGSISVNISGGSGTYSYNWNPAQENAASISNLSAGTYSLTVTDTQSNCTQTASYQVMDQVDDLAIGSANVEDETCAGNNGAITLGVTGGCLPYTFQWSVGSIGNTPNAQNLAAGNYSVTITDVNNMLVTGSYTVDPASMPMIVGAPNIISSTGNDGSISINVEGGAMPYNYQWSGPTAGLPNSNTITDLIPGDYSVIVTDAAGCSVTFPEDGTAFTVPNDNAGTDPEITGVEAVMSGTNYSLRCVGDMDGAITGNISSGMAPFTITLSGDESRTISAASKGTFTIDGLSAGTYTVTVSNGGVDAVVEDIVISEPSDKLEFDLDTGCDKDSQCDGFIDLNVKGGDGEYTYTWSNPNLSGDSADGLCAGTYSALVQDENGCEIMESITIDNCTVVNPNCYLVRNVITPNADGKNDVFSITCINDFPASLHIYDRWGKLVYNQDVYTGNWDGTSNNGDVLKEGGYMYVVNINFGSGKREIMKGTVTILRD